MPEDNNSSLPAADGYAPSLPDSDSTTIASFLDFKFQAASEEFDRTMCYVNQAVATERERCARIVDLAYREYDGWSKNPSEDACRALLASLIRSGHDMDWRQAPPVDPLTISERERCAKIADAHMPDCDGNGCDFIAAKIRSGE